MLYTKEFGKIETVWENVPVGGLLIREENGGILLEERLDTEGSFDVVHLFGEGKTLRRKADLRDVLCTAREYRPDLDEPLFVKVVRSAKDKEDENAEKARRDYFASAVEKSANHPWDCVW